MIESLTHSNGIASNTRARSFTIDPGASEYVWYCYPDRLGAVTFTVGGFEGGFDDPLTTSVTNVNGYAENYVGYKSNNADLDESTIVVANA